MGRSPLPSRVTYELDSRREATIRQFLPIMSVRWNYSNNRVVGFKIGFREITSFVFAPSESAFHSVRTRDIARLEQSLRPAQRSEPRQMTLRTEALRSPTAPTKKTGRSGLAAAGCVFWRMGTPARPDFNSGCVRVPILRRLLGVPPPAALRQIAGGGLNKQNQQRC